MNSTQLRQVGQALYGPRWIGGLASAVGYHRRSVVRWMAGESPIPRIVGVDLCKVMAEKIALLEAIGKEITEG